MIAFVVTLLQAGNTAREWGTAVTLILLGALVTAIVAYGVRRLTASSEARGKRRTDARDAATALDTSEAKLRDDVESHNLFVAHREVDIPVDHRRLSELVVTVSGMKLTLQEIMGRARMLQVAQRMLQTVAYWEQYLDADGYVIDEYISEPWTKMTGQSRGDMEHEKWLSMVAVADQERVRSMAERARIGKAVFSVRFFCHNVIDRSVPAQLRQLTMSPVPMPTPSSPGTHVIGYFAILIDIYETTEGAIGEGDADEARPDYPHPRAAHAKTTPATAPAPTSAPGQPKLATVDAGIPVVPVNQAPAPATPASAANAAAIASASSEVKPAANGGATKAGEKP